MAKNLEHLLSEGREKLLPISKFAFSSFEDEGFKKAWALNNLQPLWADENLKKGRRWRWY